MKTASTIYALDDWPRRLGFAVLPDGKTWVRGVWTLERVAKKTWKLARRGEQGLRWITSLRRVPAAIAEDLAEKVRVHLEGDRP